MIQVSMEIRYLVAGLQDIEKRQLRFITARALTKTAEEARGAVRDEMRTEFDRPTAYTLRGVRVLVATKSRLYSDVELADSGGRNRPSQFLRPEIEGGPRSLKGYERLLGGRFTVPGRDVRRDAYGNIPGGQITRALSDSGLLRGGVVNGGAQDQAAAAARARAKRTKRAASGKPVFFVGAPGAAGQNPKGVWERRKVGRYWVTKPILLFVDRPHYQARLEWRYTIDRVFRLRFQDHFWMSLQIARTTARKG